MLPKAGALGASAAGDGFKGNGETVGFDDEASTENSDGFPKMLDRVRLEERVDAMEDGDAAADAEDTNGTDEAPDELQSNGRD